MPRSIFKLSNGDTLDWVRLDFESISEGGKLIKAVIDMTIPERVFDFKRKCWFIPADVCKALIAGIQGLINTGKLHNWTIDDNRISVEAFDEFFTEEAKTGVIAPEPESKKSLLKKLEFIFKEQAGVFISIREDSEVQSLKKYYRQAALALHPDRNNGDHSKMAELNVVWAQLQTMEE